MATAKTCCSTFRHKAGPITFTLAPGYGQSNHPHRRRQAPSAVKRSDQTSVSDKRSNTLVNRRAFTPAPKMPPGLFFHPPEVLASPGMPGEQEFRLDSTKAIYLRLYPSFEADSPGRSKMAAVFDARKPSPLSSTIGGIPGRNAHGSIIFDYEGRAPHSWRRRKGFRRANYGDLLATCFHRRGTEIRSQVPTNCSTSLPMISVEKNFGPNASNLLTGGPRTTIAVSDDCGRRRLRPRQRVFDSARWGTHGRGQTVSVPL